MPKLSRGFKVVSCLLALAWIMAMTQCMSTINDNNRLLHQGQDVLPLQKLPEASFYADCYIEQKTKVENSDSDEEWTELKSYRTILRHVENYRSRLDSRCLEISAGDERTKNLDRIEYVWFWDYGADSHWDYAFIIRISGQYRVFEEVVFDGAQWWIRASSNRDHPDIAQPDITDEQIKYIEQLRNNALRQIEPAEKIYYQQSR